jgi:hypothetical protein
MDPSSNQEQQVRHFRKLGLKANDREMSATQSPLPSGEDKGIGSPVYVYHHIPKCGGTSLLDVLEHWFSVRRDYRQGWAQEFHPPVDLSTLDGRHCLCGHFDGADARLERRYPAVIGSPRFRLFTVVREPLALVLSLYRWEGQMGIRRDDVLERYLIDHVGFLADALGATAENWPEVLARYFFIGLLERLEASVDLLAKCIGKPRVPLPRLNATDPYARAPHRRRLSAGAIARFRAANRLDEAIYAACVQRFALETRLTLGYSESSISTEPLNEGLS